MKLYETVFARGGLTALLVLAGGSGAVLILSMPWAGTVADFFRFPWRPTPIALVLSVAVFGAVHALARGGTVELLPRLQRRHVLSLPFQILIAQMLVAPYFVACTVLMPESRIWTLAVAWGYVGIVDFALALASIHVGLRSARRAVNAFPRLLALGAATFCLPLALGLPLAPVRSLALLSPPYAVYSIALGPLTGRDFALAFGAPALAAALLFLAALRRIPRSLHD